MIGKKPSISSYNSVVRISCESCHKNSAHYRIKSLPFDTIDANKKDELNVCYSCLESLIDVWWETGESFDVPLLRLDNYTETTLCCIPSDKTAVACRIS